MVRVSEHAIIQHMKRTGEYSRVRAVIELESLANRYYNSAAREHVSFVRRDSDGPDVPTFQLCFREGDGNGVLTSVYYTGLPEGDNEVIEQPSSVSAALMDREEIGRPTYTHSSGYSSYINYAALKALGMPNAVDIWREGNMVHIAPGTKYPIVYSATSKMSGGKVTAKQEIRNNVLREWKDEKQTWFVCAAAGRLSFDITDPSIRRVPQPHTPNIPQQQQEPPVAPPPPPQHADLLSLLTMAYEELRRRESLFMSDGDAKQLNDLITRIDLKHEAWSKAREAVQNYYSEP